jgi:hypothetical protein
VAHFKPKAYSDSLVINEIMYNPADDFNTDDWVEFYNPMQNDLDISNWVFKDEDDEHVFTFPEGTIIPTAGYLVLCKDSELFSGLFPEVTNFVGDMSFGLSGSGELIRLYDETGALVDTVYYLDDEPWPNEPDGEGPTLELVAPHLDNALAQNWMASPLHGTPGAMNSMMVGIQQNEAKLKSALKLMIYPNPVTNNAMISLSSREQVSQGQLQIFDMFGSKVMEINDLNTNSINIDCKNLSSGVYSLRLNFNTDQSIRGKMVVR